MDNTRASSWGEERYKQLENYILKELCKYVENNFDQYESEKIIEDITNYGLRNYYDGSEYIYYSTNGSILLSDLGDDVKKAVDLFQRLRKFNRQLSRNISYQAEAEKLLFSDKGEYFRGVLATIVGTQEN